MYILMAGTNCNHILAAKACSAICSTLSGPSTESVELVCVCFTLCVCVYRTVLLGVEVLWNILEHGSQLQVCKKTINVAYLIHSQVAEQMNSLDSIW